MLSDGLLCIVFKSKLPVYWRHLTVLRQQLDQLVHLKKHTNMSTFPPYCIQYFKLTNYETTIYFLGL